MGLIKEFKQFAVKGNMMDMAVGIIIGTAFNRVVDVLVKQIVMPPLSMMTDGINFSNRRVVLKSGTPAREGVEAIEEVVIGYGALIEAFIDFLIIGFTIFLVLRLMNKFRKKAEDPKDKTVETPKDIELLTNLTELLQEQNDILKNNLKK